MDALLGALNLGDIGIHFPKTDEYNNISSLTLLAKVRTLIKHEGWSISNIDATVVAQRPQIMPYRSEIAANIAKALEIDVNCVSIKATTEEGLGFTGLGQGIAAHAVCLTER
jgi:2-C-methyl-D-erythritol 2,4-cyclodiphosphate synthase